MTLTARDYYSAEVAQSENGQSVSPLKPNEKGGRLRITRFTLTVPTATIVATKNVIVAKLPKGARILGVTVMTDGLVTAGDMDVGLSGADATGFIGAGVTADSDNMLADALDVAAAGAVYAASTLALNYGYETLKEVYLTITNPSGAATWAAGKLIAGHVEYVVD